MHLTLIEGTEDRLAECREVFLNSEIYARYFAEAGKLERILRRAAQAGELYLAVTDADEVAGVIRLNRCGFCGLCPYLALLGAKEGFRGQGVGRFLMDQVDAKVRAWGYRRVALMVSDFNAPARAFYERIGYRTLGLIPDAAMPGIGEYLMLKDLPDGPC